MSEEYRRHHRIMTHIPVGVHFVDGEILEGWGRIRNISVGGLEMRSHFPMKVGQKIYLTFDVEGYYQFRDLPARVVRVRNVGDYYAAGIALEELSDREHLRQAIVFLIDRT